MRQIGGRHIVTKRQTDTHFYLDIDGSTRFRRLKIDKQLCHAELVGYTDGYSGGFREVDYQVVHAHKNLKSVWGSAPSSRSVVNAGRSFSLPKTRLSTFPEPSNGRCSTSIPSLAPGRYSKPKSC